MEAMKYFCEQRPNLTLTFHREFKDGKPSVSEDLQFVKGMFTPKDEKEIAHIEKTNFFRNGEIKKVPLRFEPLMEPSGLPGEIVKPEDIKKLVQHVNLGALDPTVKKALEDKARSEVRAEVDNSVKQVLSDKDARIAELEAKIAETEAKKSKKG